MSTITARWYTSAQDIPKDQCAKLLGADVIPFYDLNWLKILENSGSVSKGNGWQPLHLMLWRDETAIAFAPLYLKSHSYGEFIFDQAFAQLAGDLQLNYYPKLIGMSPFSPVEGYRFFIKESECEQDITNLIMNIIDAFASQNQILSCNFLYIDQEWLPIAEASKCCTWLNKKSLWQANGQKDFEDYLNSFNANQRRNIRRERKSIAEKGIKVSTITGSEINATLLNLMHNFYEEHCARWGAWGSKYLSQSFFQKLSQYKDQEAIVLFLAHRQDSAQPIAMSMCIRDKENLWGRYWGSKEEIDNLHFEVCYYSPISWALRNGIQNFDPGAGGKHKQRRGFFAKPHASVHRWYDKRMDQIMRDWLPKANRYSLEEIEANNANLPFEIEQPKPSFLN